MKRLQSYLRLWRFFILKSKLWRLIKGDNMKNKYSKEFLKTVLENKEYEVIGEIKSSNDKVLCKTKEGYLVLPIPQGIIRRNDDACIFQNIIHIQYII